MNDRDKDRLLTTISCGNSAFLLILLSTLRATLAKLTKRNITVITINMLILTKKVRHSRVVIRPRITIIYGEQYSIFGGCGAWIGRCAIRQPLMREGSFTLLLILRCDPPPFPGNGADGQMAMTSGREPTNGGRHVPNYLRPSRQVFSPTAAMKRPALSLSTPTIHASQNSHFSPLSRC